jgi:hypothetical protein
VPGVLLYSVKICKEGRFTWATKLTLVIDMPFARAMPCNRAPRDCKMRGHQVTPCAEGGLF